MSPPLPPAKRKFRFRVPRFTIFGLMVFTFVVAIAFTPAYYMMRAMRGETGYRAASILSAVAVPMALMVLLSVGLRLRAWMNRKKR